MRIGLIGIAIWLLGSPAVQAKAKFDLQEVDAVKPSAAKAKTAPAAISLPAAELKRNNAITRPETLMDKARAASAMPLPLLETAAEREKQTELLREQEAIQLQHLWAATLDLYPDIQFAINMLQPHSDQKHAKSKAVQMIGGLVASAGQAAPLAFPNGGLIRMGTGFGAGMLNSVIRDQSNNKGQVSEDNVAASYSMIRHTADRLTDAYRSYKNSLDTLVIVEEEAVDAKKIREVVSETGGSAMLADYTVKKAERDVRQCKVQAYTFREQLVDLCGGRAVAKLDKQIAEEHRLLVRATGSSTFRPALDFIEPSNAQLDNETLVP
jgi:hypothetical protein